MATISSGKGKGPLVDPALCRCCRSIKKCRLLTAEYEWMGKREVYSEMFMDSFGLLLSHLDGESKESCICATCVVRLRDACAFRQQVLQCEEAFISATLQRKEEADHKVEVTVKTEPILEPELDSHMDERDESDHQDMDADMDLALAEIKKAHIQEKDTQDTVKNGRRSRRKSLNKDIITKMTRLRAKLDQMLDKPVTMVKKEKLPPKQKKKRDIDHDQMVYTNAVTIVHNSYVCPFHNRISIYYCYYCKDQFTNPNELRDHTQTHDPKTFETLMENKKIPKIDITRVDCRLCDAKIENLEDFKRHLSSVHEKLVYPVQNEFLKFKLTLSNITCTECDSSFPYFDLLKKHMIEHFGTYICDVCGACFLEYNSLRTHISSHNKVESNFPCEICGKNLKSKYSRYLHVATVHEKKPTVNCYKCEASFLSYALRNRHLIEVHGDKRTFPCKLCDKVYNRRKTLMEHNRRNHLKVYRHQCDLCEQRFYLPSRLREHMATHTGERNYRCEFCDKSYPRLQSLQEHVRSHGGGTGGAGGAERRHKCGACGASFTHGGSLRAHARSHHPPYIDNGFS